MSFCRNCGTQLPEGSVFCNQCGTRDTLAAPAPCTTTKKSGRGFAISSMILGIIGLLYSTVLWLMIGQDPFDITEAFWYMLIVTGGMPGIATILSIVALVRGWKNGFSKAGLITGALGVCSTCLALFVYFVLKIVSL